MINWHEFGMGFWIAFGVIAAVLIASLFTGVFRKVA